MPLQLQENAFFWLAVVGRTKKASALFADVIGNK